jgi:hypothetical protein
MTGKRYCAASENVLIACRDAASVQANLIRMSETPGPVPRFYARKSVSVASTRSDDDEVPSEEDMLSDTESEVELQGVSTPGNTDYPTETVAPPQIIRDTLRRIVNLDIPLPFLRRNIRLSFHATFMRQFQNTRSLPKVLKPNSAKRTVYWEYQLRESVQEDPSKLLKWKTPQKGFLCQLCTVFPAFTSDSALLFHIKKDHREVTATIVRNKIFISLQDPNESE